MAEIPLPGIETLTKVSSWLTKQAKRWLGFVRDPREFDFLFLGRRGLAPLPLIALYSAVLILIALKLVPATKLLHQFGSVSALLTTVFTGTMN